MKKYLVQLATRIDVTLMQALDAHAAETGQSKASIIEAALKAWLKGGK